jgi:hypothetical protein
MTDFVYRVVTSDDEVYWVDDHTTILDSFGTVSEVTRYLLVDPTDLTDAVNGNYYLDE